MGSKKLSIKKGEIMTDKDKFKKLFKEVGIKYVENGDVLEIDQFHTDGIDDCAISFYEDGKFQDFLFYK